MTTIAVAGRPLRLPTLRWRPLLTAGGAALGAVLLLTVVLPQLSVANTATEHWESPLPVIVLGLTTGLTYGLLGVGLVLIYRTNRIINFAYGEIGAFGAAFFRIEVVKWHLPYWLAFLPALAVAGAVGALAEAAVIRRLRKAPLIMSVVATLGVGQFLLLFKSVISNDAGAGASYPQPAGLPSFPLGALFISRSYFGMLTLCPLLIIAVACFLKFSRFGLALRGAAANPEAARMAGIFSSRMSSLAWAIAGGLTAFAAILTAPTQGATGAGSFGPSLLLRALACAVIARMASIPIALVAGAALGVIEQLLLWNFRRTPGLVDVALFLIILAALLLQKQRIGRAEEKGSWAAVQALRPIPAALRELWVVRRLGLLVGLGTLAAFALLPLRLSNTDSATLTGIFAFVIIGLSVGVITGLAGQLSLGQFALAAVGAVASFEISRRTGNFFESFLYAGLASAAVSVLIGLPALRIRGLLLTVTTLSFALVARNFLLPQSWVLSSGGKDPGRPIVGGNALTTGREYYFVALATVVVAMVLARNIRSGGVGRLLVAVRDNEEVARSFTVPASLVKLQGFALAGFLAGVGGAMYGHSLPLISADSFPTDASINVVKIAVIGGLSLLAGPLLGAVVVLGIPLLPLDSAGLAATALGQLLIIMYLPGGLAQLVGPLRDRVVGFLGRRAGIDVEAAYLAEASGVVATGGAGAPGGETLTADRPAASAEPRAVPAHVAAARPRRSDSGLILSAHGLRKSFGGVRAVRGVSFDVRTGETLGLIGPNGAGKTTTFELLAGFTKADDGTVTFAGRDVTYLSPEARGRLGLIRSFQDAALFPTLTVAECVQLALERVDPTRLLPAIAGLSGQERRKERAARELVNWMGLDRYRSSQIQELSTGTRRIAEIACLVALQPTLLLLDEPSSGVAQRETEALGTLLVRLREQLSLTLVIIEHDIPLIMGISDRIVAMADGEVIAAGTPDIVRSDPAVVEAYLGGSLTAIERSGGAAVPGHDGRGRNGRVAHRNDEPQVVDLLALASAVPGLGVVRERALLDAFGSVEGVCAASLKELVAVPGIGPGVARRIADALAASGASAGAAATAAAGRTP